jgi:hypothetical protein
MKHYMDIDVDKEREANRRARQRALWCFKQHTVPTEVISEYLQLLDESDEILDEIERREK